MAIQRYSCARIVSVLYINQFWSNGNGLCMQYPVTATQWHPEKNVFEWATHLHVPHTYEAVRFGSIIFDAKTVAARIS